MKGGKGSRRMLRRGLAAGMALIFALSEPAAVYVAAAPTEGEETVLELTEVGNETEESASENAASENEVQESTSANETDESTSENKADESASENASDETTSENEAEDTDETVSENETEDTDETASENEAVENVSENMTEEIAEPEEGEAEIVTADGGSVTFSVSGGVTSASLSTGASGIEAALDEESGVMSVTISAAGSYTLSGTAVNTVIAVDKKVTGVTLTLNGLSVDDSALAEKLGADSAVIACGKKSSVELVLSGSNSLKGSSTLVAEPEAVVKAPSATLTISGTGSLAITDSMPATTDFTVDGVSVDPADGLSAKEGTLNLNGGTITITANGSAVKAKAGTINFAGSAVTVTYSGDDAVKAKDGVVNVTDGSLTVVKSLGDGIKAGWEDAEDSSAVKVVISGGTVDIQESYGDGIQAENIDISGGTVNIVTVFDDAAGSYYTSGSSSTTLNTIVENNSTKTERVNVDSGSHKGLKAGTKAATRIYSDIAEGDPAKTVVDVASGGLTISGGTITIDTTGVGLKANTVSTSGYTKCSNGVYIIGSPDDAISSNNDLSISGGNITINSSDDGIGAAGDLTISGTATVTVEKAFEGIEASNIVIGTEGSSTGPTVVVNSNDDGFNASSKSLVYTYDSSDNEDYNYTKVSTSRSDNSISIYSGKVTVKIDSANSKSVTLDGKSITYKAGGDGLDSNGTLNLDGGTTYVFGQSSGDNSPIDHDSGFTLGSAATVLAAGASGMSSESVPGYGDGVYITYGSSSGGMGGGPGGGNSSSISAGSVFTVNTNPEFSETLPYAASFVLFASPLLTKGSSYTMTIGSSSSSVTASAPSSSGSAEVTVNSLSLNKDSATISIGGSTTLTATVSTSGGSSGSGMGGGPGGGNSSNYNIEWISSDTSVAQVAGSSTTGTVYGKSAGTATITASYGGKTATATITVSETLITAITLSTDSAEMEVGDMQTLTASITPTWASNTTLTWSSSNESVATVDSDGVVTAVAAGTATITATATDGSKLSASATITVSGTAAVETTVAVNPTTLSLTAGKNGTITAAVVTSDNSTPELSWESSDTSVVSITATDGNKAMVMGMKAGTANVTATANGVSASCAVTVSAEETVTTTVSVSPTEKNLTVGDSCTITAETAYVYTDVPIILATTNGSNTPELSWESSDTSVVSITATEDNTVTVKALKAGTANVTATFGDASASCAITVKDKASEEEEEEEDEDLRSGQDTWVETSEDEDCGGDAISEDEKANESNTFYKGEMVKGQKYKFTSTGGIWTSTNKKVVSVNKKTGKATAKKAGTAVLVNTRDDGKTYYTITVYTPTLSVSKQAMVVGDSAEISISNTGDMAVSWISSNTSVVQVTDSYYVDEDADSACRILAVGKGSAKLKVYVGGKLYSVKITVKDVTTFSKLADETEAQLSVLQSFTPKFSSGFSVKSAEWYEEDGVTPLSCTNNVWTDAEGLVSISKAGKITGTGVGEITLIAKKGDSSVKLNLTIVAVPTRSDIYLNVGQSTTLKHSYATNKNISGWTIVSQDEEDLISLTNETKAKVKITGNKVGTAELKCTCAGVEYITTVHVESPSLTTDDSLVWKKNEVYTLTMKVGDTYRITQEDVDQQVFWLSSSKTKAFVSEYGIIYARAKGKVTVKAKVNNKWVKIKVTITE